jgi:hypothetical protein
VDQPLSTMRSVRTVFLIMWSEGKGMFKWQRTEMTLKYAHDFITRKMAAPTLGEAILRVGTMNRMLGTGKAADHFINTAGVKHGLQLPGEHGEGFQTQEGVPGEPPEVKANRARPGGYSKAYRRDRA